MVQTNKPLRKVINNLEVVGWLVLLAIELSEFDILYWPRATIKAQTLADFIAEFTTKEDEEVEPMVWMIWMDGSSN